MPAILWKIVTETIFEKKITLKQHIDDNEFYKHKYILLVPHYVIFKKD